MTSFGQQKPNVLNEALLGSFHAASYADESNNGERVHVAGFGFEYRKNIDSLSSRFNLCLGVGLETVPLRRNRDNDDYFRNTHINLTLPIGIYYQIAETYFIGFYASMDFPLASAEKSRFNGVEFSNNEFDFRFLNINFSGGVNVLKTYVIGDKQFIVEVHAKALGLLGLKDNDYWHYPEDSVPCYFGLRLGYGF